MINVIIKTYATYFVKPDVGFQCAYLSADLFLYISGTPLQIGLRNTFDQMIWYRWIIDLSEGKPITDI